MAASAKCIRLAEQWRASAEAEVEAAKALRATGQNWGQVYWHAGFAIEQMIKAIRIKREGFEECQRPIGAPNGTILSSSRTPSSRMIFARAVEPASLLRHIG
jgi:hypothetical protein